MAIKRRTERKNVDKKSRDYYNNGIAHFPIEWSWWKNHEIMISVSNRLSFVMASESVCIENSSISQLYIFSFNDHQKIIVHLMLARHRVLFFQVHLLIIKVKRREEKKKYRTSKWQWFLFLSLFKIGLIAKTRPAQWKMKKKKKGKFWLSVFWRKDYNYHHIVWWCAQHSLAH